MKEKKKNILYLTKTMGIGGTEKVIMQLCRNFLNDFDKIIVCSKGGVHEEELQRLGIKTYNIPDFDDKNIVNIIRTIKILIKIIKEEDIGIIHTHHRMAALYSKFLKKFFDFSIIHTMHNTFIDKKFLTKLALKDIRIIAVGESVRKNLIDFYNIDESKISIIYNGVEMDTKIKDEIEEISKHRNQNIFCVGNIGRLSEQKGMKYFIEACKIIKDKEMKMRFFIIGDGELKSELIRYCKELDLINDVVFLGYRSDISNIINSLDLIAISSLWEGLPLTPIEVFMNKKTIVATNVEGTLEIVKDNYNGLVVKKRSSENLAEAIIKLYNDRELIRKFEENAYETYINNFSIDRFIYGYREIYNNE